MSDPFTNGQNGSERDGAGRFRLGWRGGPGRPGNQYAIKFAAIVDEVFDAVVTKERLTVAVDKCLSTAEQGDLQALREILLRMKGPPQPADVTIRLELVEQRQNEILAQLEKPR